MTFLRKKARLIFSGLIVLSFFIPSYQDISGFRFISIAYSVAGKNSEITSTDVLIAIVPLLTVPISSVVIFIRTLLKIATKKMYSFLPLFGVIAFTILLIISAKKGSGNLSGLKMLTQMHIGFYLAIIASAILPFTKNPRKRKVKRRRTAETELAV